MAKLNALLIMTDGCHGVPFCNLRGSLINSNLS